MMARASLAADWRVRSVGAALCALLGGAEPARAGTMGLVLAGEPRTLHFSGGRAEAVVIVVRWVDSHTEKPVERAARLYLASDYERIGFPSEPTLGADGRATLRLAVFPPPPGKACEGRFTVRVILDEEDADDTMDARIAFTYSAAREATGCVASQAPASAAGPATR
jgi:hypothetical protein